MAKDRGLELKVGILITIAGAVLVAFVFVLGNFSLGKGYNLWVDFNFSGNIQPGAPVKVSGIKVGKVEDVEFHGGAMDEDEKRRVQVRVKLWVQERVRDAIREDAEFFVSTAGVLGEQYIEIVPGTHERPPLGEGKKRVGIDPPRTDLLIARLNDFLLSTTKLLKDDKDLIKNLLKSSGEAVANLNLILQDNRAQLGTLIAASARLADEATGLIGDIRKGLGDPRVVGRGLAAAEATLSSAHRALDALTPRAGRLLDEGTRAAALVTEARLDRALHAVDDARAMMAKASGLVGNVDGMVSDLRAGKGTAGALLVREELYADLKEMVRDLKRNPWKFLWKE